VWDDAVCHNVHHTGWRRPIGCLKLQVIFRKRATNYTAFSREMTCKDKACCASWPPCITHCVIPPCITHCVIPHASICFVLCMFCFVYVLFCVCFVLCMFCFVSCMHSFSSLNEPLCMCTIHTNEPLCMWEDACCELFKLGVCGVMHIVASCEYVVRCI